MDAAISLFQKSAMKLTPTPIELFRFRRAIKNILVVFSYYIS